MTWHTVCSVILNCPVWFANISWLTCTCTFSQHFSPKMISLANTQIKDLSSWMFRVGLVCDGEVQVEACTVEKCVLYNQEVSCLGFMHKGKQALVKLYICDKLQPSTHPIKNKQNKKTIMKINWAELSWSVLTSWCEKNCPSLCFSLSLCVPTLKTMSLSLFSGNEDTLPVLGESAFTSDCHTVLTLSLLVLCKKANSKVSFKPLWVWLKVSSSELFPPLTVCLHVLKKDFATSLCNKTELLLNHNWLCVLCSHVSCAYQQKEPVNTAYNANVWDLFLYAY